MERFPALPIHRGFSRAIVEVGIAYETDIDQAISVLEEVAEKSERTPRRILEPATIHRIVRLDSSEWF